MSNRPARFETNPDVMDVPAEYETWPAAEKHGWLWSTLISSTAHSPTTLPPLRMPFQQKPLKEILIVTRRHELEKALDRTDDLMEPGRPKVIHARGAVSMIEFATDDQSPFTGILGPQPAGGAIGLIRMSLVAQVKRNAAYTPALALKLLIDGKPSADVLAMNHTVGQGRDFDLFSNTMTNDLSEEHKELRTAQRVMSVLFERISEQPRRLVVTHLANQTKAGATVTNPVEPRRLVFHPTPNARQIFSAKAGVDFRLVLAGVPAGTELYEVEGLTESGGTRVGTIRTTSPFVSSEGGDRLYFRHVQDPNDRKKY